MFYIRMVNLHLRLRDQVRAGVAEWQTRQTQNLLMVTLCGFKSRRRQLEKKA